jgi:hypothetical protein
MNVPLIWLHEEALRITHPVFKAAHTQTKAVYVWDDEYLRKTNYSLKRLVFIYETLCDLPVDILHGDTLGVIRELEPSALFVPATNNPLILNIITSLKTVAPFQIIEEEPFAVMSKPKDFSRFFQYWNKVEKIAFLNNGGADA